MQVIQTRFSDLKIDSTSADWDKEYNNYKVIPSSTRTLPSKALTLFSELLQFHRNLKVLDAGCGIGRNAVYLAQKGCEVHAVDFSDAALQQLNSLAKREGVANKISSYKHPLEEPFPFTDNSFDIALDSYVFCHFTNANLQLHYRDELHRVTKPGGTIFSSLFSVTDEYYAEILKKQGHGGKIVIDPNNGITKQLYTEADVKMFFSERFDIQYFVEFQFQDIVLGTPFRRNIFALVLRK
jgi:ubiquinone/menaquinone biosynthesis C-methylase UbiE